MALELGHRRELERSLARLGLDRAVGKDLVIGARRRIAADQARRPLRLRALLNGLARLERGQMPGAIDVDRALVLRGGRLVNALRRLLLGREGSGGNLSG